RLWETMFRDGQRLLREGKHDQALKEFKAALNLAAKFEEDDPRRTQSLNGLAIAHTVRQEFADAEPLFQKAVELLLSQTHGEEDLELARVLKHLALVYNSQHKFQLAEESYGRCLRIYERLAPSHADVETVRQQMSKIQKRVQELKRRQTEGDMLVIVKSKPAEAPEAEAAHAAPRTASAPAATDQAGKPPVGISAVRQGMAEIRPMPLEDMVGKVLDDRYQVLERVASGGMSVIYKARHALLDRMVAIKVMHPHLVSNMRNVRRFSQEAKTACGLTHPNIVTVRDFGVTRDGLCYIVMDYVEGETLATRINREHHIEGKEFVPICQQIVDALMYAHSCRVLHRDLKPSNIMICKVRDSEVVKIVDFGIAKMVSSGEEEALSLTQTGETVGSPLYMSPEQCRGQEVDIRSDIYSLGCLAYKSLTGFPPFLGGSDIDVYFKHINEEPPPFATACPDIEVPIELEQIVMQTLQKSPSRRQQNMQELRHQLDDLHL
ncbi:MAG TPA: protein kinase, partial [Candidatus Obscuribacterales bacterium]